MREPTVGKGALLEDAVGPVSSNRFRPLKLPFAARETSTSRPRRSREATAREGLRECYGYPVFELDIPGQRRYATLRAA